MELKPTVEARQQLALSPRLYQSLKVLRLSAADLLSLIQKELNENPTLELPEPSDFDLEAVSAGTGQAAEQELWRDLEAAHRDEYAPARRDPFRAGAPARALDLAASPVTLADHLSLQLNLLRLSDRKHRAALAVIGSLDDDGYLREPIAEIAATTNRPAAEIEEALAIVQGFDPPGIAARSLEECLVIQLKQMNAGKLAIEIAEMFLPQVAKGAFTEIARELKVPSARVRRAVELIRGLNPSPGSLFDINPPAAAVIPDVYVNMEEGRVRVLANREILPSLHVSRMYREMAKDAAAAAGADKQTVSYIKSKMREASRLIRDINERRATVTKVAQAIAQAQPEFFRQGPEHLRPLTLDDIAARLEVHPSTISRAILGKYMSTPFGIFEFRFFFSSGYSSREAGGLAATAVKKRLKNIIDEEDRQRPLSDQKLTGLLKKDGIPISRRTVAKYREEMEIPASWERKQQA